MVNPSQPQKLQHHEHSSMVARLLATENIRIEHGNYETAFFDLNERVLGLPNWTDMSKSTYDMMVGHEVGHALFTPTAEWLSSLSGCPKEYLNIVEDIRIERLIQETYPGLVRQFRDGYTDLQKRDSFGLKGRDPQTLGIADRVNLRAKLGDRINVSFSDAEKTVVDACFSAKTWDEVVAAAKALAKFASAQAAKEEAGAGKQSPSKDSAQDTENQTGPSGESNDTHGSGNESGDQPSDETSKDAASTENQKSNSSSSKDSDESSSNTQGAGQDTNQSDSKSSESTSEQKSGSSSSSSSENSEASASAGLEGSNGDPFAAPKPMTLDALDKATSNLIDRSYESNATRFLGEPLKEDCMSRVIDYKTLFKSRDINYTYQQIKADRAPAFEPQRIEFLKETKKFASTLRKQFELRKAASQYSRSKQSKSGELDMKKLHLYKTSDDIFLSVTSLADAKDHGVVMFVDYSESMTYVMPHIIKHLINLVTFCKMTNIPFEVYGFTSHMYEDENQQKRLNTILLKHTYVFELLSSAMSTSEYNRAINDLLLAANAQTTDISKFEKMGGTPLNETLVIAHHIIDRFKDRYRRQKNIAVVLTDGEPNNCTVHVPVSRELDTRYQNSTQKARDCTNRQFVGGRTQFELFGRLVKTTLGKSELYPALVANLRKTTGCTVLGFFVPSATSNSGVRSALSRYSNDYSALVHEVPVARRMLNKDKVYVKANAGGYDKFFLVSSGRDLDTGDDDLDISPDMSKSRMASAFTAYGQSKKANRVFVTKFAEAIS